MSDMPGRNKFQNEPTETESENDKTHRREKPIDFWEKQEKRISCVH
jgi:hypothetical protein